MATTASSATPSTTTLMCNIQLIKDHYEVILIDNPDMYPYRNVTTFMNKINRYKDRLTKAMESYDKVFDKYMTSGRELNQYKHKLKQNCNNELILKHCFVHAEIDYSIDRLSGYDKFKIKTSGMWRDTLRVLYYGGNIVELENGQRVPETDYTIDMIYDSVEDIEFLAKSIYKERVWFNKVHRLHLSRIKRIKQYL